MIPACRGVLGPPHCSHPMTRGDFPTPVMRIFRSIRQENRCALRRWRRAPLASISTDSAAWGLRLSLENTYLSYARNGMISTAVACAIMQYRRDQKSCDHEATRPPYGAGTLVLLGGAYVWGGCWRYVRVSWALRNTLQLGPSCFGWLAAHSIGMATLWTIAVMFLFDTPFQAILETLQTPTVQAILPAKLVAQDAQPKIDPGSPVSCSSSEPASESHSNHTSADQSTQHKGP